MAAKINVQAMEGSSSGEVMNLIQKIMEEDEFFRKDYKISWVDMSYQERGNEGKIVGLMLLALVFGYLFLVGQYESWSIPIPVIASVAVATLGGLMGIYYSPAIPNGFWGLYYSDLALSIYAQLGLIMLVGIVVNNAIVLIDYTNTLRREQGMGARQIGLRGRARRRVAALPRRADDGVELRDRRFPDGDRRRRRRRQPPRHRRDDLLGHGAGHPDRHRLHSGALQLFPADPRMGQAR